ncbi:MAG: N-acetylmuramoyl-L-alanine amidase [Proteobacteria bacterium]|nr:N-acetylmuramoyl-L-alanine amidase [Pseudomonadota bacterium]
MKKTQYSFVFFILGLLNLISIPAVFSATDSFFSRIFHRNPANSNKNTTTKATSREEIQNTKTPQSSNNNIKTDSDPIEFIFNKGACPDSSLVNDLDQLAIYINKDHLDERISFIEGLKLKLSDGPQKSRTKSAISSLNLSLINYLNAVQKQEHFFLSHSQKGFFVKMKTHGMDQEALVKNDSLEQEVTQTQLALIKALKNSNISKKFKCVEDSLWLSLSSSDYRNQHSKFLSLVENDRNALKNAKSKVSSRRFSPNSNVNIVSRAQWWSEEAHGQKYRALSSVNGKKRKYSTQTVSSQDPKWFQERKQELTYDEIVIHHTDGSQSPNLVDMSLFHRFQKPFKDLGYHFVIKKDARGEWKIFEGTPLGYRGCHASDCNARSIGVSIAGDYDKDAVPEEVVTLLTKLQDQIAMKYPIEHVRTHRDKGHCLTGVCLNVNDGHDCPGKHMVPYVSALSARLAQTRGYAISQATIDSLPKLAGTK